MGESGGERPTTISENKVEGENTSGCSYGCSHKWVVGASTFS